LGYTDAMQASLCFYSIEVLSSLSATETPTKVLAAEVKPSGAAKQKIPAPLQYLLKLGTTSLADK